MNLKELLNERELYQLAPPVFKNYFNTGYYADIQVRTNSRNVNDALQQTYRKHWDSRNSLYLLLAAMCGYYLERKVFTGFTNYTVTSDTTLTDILREFPYDYEVTDTNINIVYCYISRGKTFLDKRLEEQCADTERIQPLEQLLKTHDSHYIRIYKNFPVHRFTDRTTHNNKYIVIFTDYISGDIIAQVTTLLPHILELKEIPEKKDQYAAIMKIFEYLFETAKNANGTVAELVELLKQYNALCHYTENNFKKFTETLANLRNSKFQRMAQSKLERNKQEIEDYEQRLAQLYEDSYRLELTALQNAPTPLNMQAFIEYIEKAPTIEIINATDQRLTLKVTAPFQYFRENDLEIREKNSRSEYNMRIRNETDCPEIHKNILHKIFITREYKLLAQAIIEFSLDASLNSSRALYYNVKTNLSDYDQMPNPHMYHFNCWSKAQTAMDKAIAENQFEVMLAQMVAAVQSINISEDPSFAHRFMTDWFDSSYTPLIHVIVEDGTALNYDQIIEYEKTMQKMKNKKPEPEPTNVETPRVTSNSPEDIAQRLAELEESAAGNYTQIELPDED